MGKLIYLAMILSVFIISGCQSTLFDEKSVDQRQKEYILSKVNNYQGMISLYRDKLSQKEDRDTRLKLAELYYLVEDYESSRHYLKPLLENPDEEKGWLLEGKNLLETGSSSQALAALDRVQRLARDNGEAWNLRGVLLAKSGDFVQARKAFSEARLRFVDDNIVLNNLAMLEIMQENYPAARDYLMPLYARGNVTQKMLHNLVFVLVKLQDFQAAEEILRQEKMYTNRDGLLESLAKIKPRTPQQLQRNSILKDFVVPSAGVAQVNLNSTGVTAASDNFREISVIRSGQHAAYFRITLESSAAINYREVKASGKNRRAFELYDVKIGSGMLDEAQRIASRHNEIKKVSFSRKNANTMLMEIDFSREVHHAKVFRLSKNNQIKERLIFDIFYG